MGFGYVHKVAKGKASGQPPAARPVTTGHGSLARVEGAMLVTDGPFAETKELIGGGSRDPGEKR
jgi:hypothetical protein